MEHFTNNVSEDDDLDFNSRSKDYNDLDIEAILERSRISRLGRCRPLYESPEFVVRLEAFIEVTCGGSVTFQCQWKACPRPQIKWFKDDEEIPEDHPYFSIEANDNDGYVRLILTELTKQDEGAYKCKAENQEGVASTTGYLSVTGDDGDKTLNSQQKTAKSQNPDNSPTSPNISLAPHLCTILEQQSLEEREAEVQRRLPPSPLQNYIETVQKTKTLPLAKMGYNPDDFIEHLEIPNGLAPEENEDAQSSSSDTSVDSQPDIVSKVTTNVQSRNTSVKSIAKVTRKEDPIQRTDSLESEHDSDENEDTEAEDSRVKPVCTVSVQIRSESGISRLTKIRQDEKRRLSLVLPDDIQYNAEEQELKITEDSAEVETPKVSDEQLRLEKAKVQEESVSEKKDFNSRNIVKGVDHINSDQQTKQVPLPDNYNLNNRNINGIILQESETTEDVVTPKVVQEMYSENKITENNAENEGDTDDTIKYLNKTTKKRHISHQKSKDRRSQIKKQKSLVEITFEWIFQRITGKVGEQLELPLIYYFAFTVLCGCLCAAIRLNPFYMIVIVFILSFLSFRFILTGEEVINTENVDEEDASSE